MTHAPDPDIAARAALRLTGPDPQNWVPDRLGIDHNVMLVGGGQTGSALAFALPRAGIGKVSVVDTARHSSGHRSDQPRPVPCRSGQPRTAHQRHDCGGFSR